MRFYTNQHQFYCGIDLHARSMYVCILKHDGEILLHRNMQAAAEPFRKAVAQLAFAGDVESVPAALHVHYEELRRWGSRTALVGAGEASRILERHYVESLLARDLVAPARRVVDFGSGAGFPGWVLSAVHPEVEFWLLESRQRKAAFLRSVTARAELSCRILNAKVSRRQPLAAVLDSHGERAGAIDLVTVRAVKLTEDIWAGIVSMLAEGARVLRWEGSEPVRALPGARQGRLVALPGSERRIQEWLLGEPPAERAARC